MVGFSLGLISFFVIPAASVVSRKTKFSDAAPLFYNPLQAILFNSTQRHGGAAFGSIGYLVALILVAPLVLVGGGCCATGLTCATDVSGDLLCCTPGNACYQYSCQEGFFQCTGENFCCPSESYCYRDGDGRPFCDDGDGTVTLPPAPAPTPTPTPQPQPQPQLTQQPQPTAQSQPQPQPQPIPTPQTASQSTPALQPTTPSQGPTPANSLVLPFTSASAVFAGQVPVATYTVSPAPAVSDSGAANSTVSARDPRIQYSSQWKDSSTCGGSSRSASDAGAQFVFQFKGSAIFMNINMGLTGLVFSADVDGATDIVDGFRTTQSCGTGWSRFDLDGSLHIVTVTILGPSQKAPSSATSQSALDFSSFTVTSEGSAVAANTGADTLHSSRSSWAFSLGFSFVIAGIMKLSLTM